MFPAWLSRRRNVQQKQPGAPPFLASSSSSFHQSHFNDTMEPPPTSFAQALSLHKGIRRARDYLLEAELAGFSTSRRNLDSRGPLSGIESPNDINYASDSCNRHVYPHTHQLQGHECTTHRPAGKCHYSSAQYDGVSSHMDSVAASNMPCLRSGIGEPAFQSTDGAAPKDKLYLLSSINEHAKVFPGDIFSLQNGSDGPQENDTEHSTVLTPDSVDSSFNSESSSAGSSLLRKCRLEESRQCLLQWPREGVDEEALLQSCYLEHTRGLPEWQEENISESLDCADCSILMENTPFLASKLEQVVESRKRHHSSGLDAEECDSLPNSNIFNLRDLHTATRLESCFYGTKIGCSSSFAKISGPMLKEVDVPSSYADLVENMNCMTSIIQSECTDSAGNGNSEYKRFFGISYSKWEESSALIAAENPSLMFSSKWQEERVEPCSSRLKQSTDHISGESNACEYGEFKLPMCAGHQQPRNGWHKGEQLEDGCNACGLQDEGNVGCDRIKDDGFPMWRLQDERNVGCHRSNHVGPPLCALQGGRNVECHKTKHDTYVKHGRRCRGSSFSAALPETLQGVVGDSVALVKMSHSPYEDFRQSMYEMIMEQDLEEGPMDVEELLHCYLTLNPPELHELIREVFSDVWSSILMSVR